MKQKSQKTLRILIDNNGFTPEQATRIISCIAEYNTSQNKQLASKDDLKMLKKGLINLWKKWSFCKALITYLCTVSIGV